LQGRHELTVAIPTFNGSRHIADALRGILAQAHTEFDLLISDDRSDDETLELVRAIAGDRARIEVNAERLGLAGNWNRCVALSGTPLVAIFHQDDVMYPGHLQSHLAHFQNDRALGLVASAADVIDQEGREVSASVVERGGLGSSDRIFAAGESLRFLATGNPLRCSGITLRAEAHAEAGGFDPSYRYVVDWEFWLRLARGWGLAWLTKPTVAIRWHAASETHRFKTGTTDLDETLRLLDDLYSKEGTHWPDARSLRRTAERKVARAFLNRAYVALREGDALFARSCLKRALALWPGILGTLACDPRLALQMSALAIAPKTAGHYLRRRGSSNVEK
jgi:glycosyltransferase involved in cell wall biosynthesis